MSKILERIESRVTAQVWDNLAATCSVARRSFVAKRKLLGNNKRDTAWLVNNIVPLISIERPFGLSAMPWPALCRVYAPNIIERGGRFIIIEIGNQRWQIFDGARNNYTCLELFDW